MASVSTICDEYCRVMRVIELSQKDSQSPQRGQRVHRALPKEFEHINFWLLDLVRQILYQISYRRSLQ